MTTPPLTVQHLHKEFGGNDAVVDINFDVHAGEVLAIVGDNGAGKSTLLKMITGVYSPTSGSIHLNGQPVVFRDASDARSHGIEVVYQDLALAEQQPVYMNIFLGREMVKGPLRRLNRKRMAAIAQDLCDDLRVTVPSVKTTTRSLSGGQRQAVAIARATHWAKSIVLMDEPTAALGLTETARVEDLIDTLRSRGLAVVIVSHNLDQVFRIADRVLVLRRGHQVADLDRRKVDRNRVVSCITGLE